MRHLIVPSFFTWIHIILKMRRNTKCEMNKNSKRNVTCMWYVIAMPKAWYVVIDDEPTFLFLSFNPQLVCWFVGWYIYPAAIKIISILFRLADIQMNNNNIITFWIKYQLKYLNNGKCLLQIFISCYLYCVEFWDRIFLVIVHRLLFNRF